MHLAGKETNEIRQIFGSLNIPATDIALMGL